MEVLRNHPTTSDTTPEDPGDDAALVLQARRGDARTFALLYHRYVDRVYAYAVWRLASREAAEEATQSVFFRALRGLPGYRGETAFAPWLFAIARNVVPDTYRARRRRTEPLETAFDVPDPHLGPDEHVIRLIQHDELQTAREQCLTERERALFDLLLADLNHQEIAHVMGRRQGAVRTAHWRLVGKLRECLAGSTAAKEVTDVAL